jgi:diguanylate cyclase (GGDEF)-like protein
MTLPRFRKVLLVDDCSSTRRLLAKELSEAGYEVDCASDGVQAMAWLDSHGVDFVITDWQMPRMDGSELCRSIRRADLPHYVHIVFMTAHSDEVDLIDGLAAGADDYVIKPVVSQELLARLRAGSRVLELERRLRFLATHDDLTGLLNRRTLHNFLKKTVTPCRDRGERLSCILTDVDFFKRINDRYGHLAGDRVLRQIAQLLASQFSHPAQVFRFGGEEFCVLLPGENEQQAGLRAEHFRRELADRLLVVEQDRLQVTASCGVAELEHVECSAETILRRADLALLAAKRLGRNRVIRHSDASTRAVAAIDPVAGNESAEPFPLAVEPLA